MPCCRESNIAPMCHPRVQDIDTNATHAKLWCAGGATEVLTRKKKSEIWTALFLRSIMMDDWNYILATSHRSSAWQMPSPGVSLLVAQAPGIAPRCKRFAMLCAMLSKAALSSVDDAWHNRCKAARARTPAPLPELAV